MTYKVSLNVSRCSGCMACVVACMDQNDLPEDGVAFRHVVKTERDDSPDMHLSFVSMACRHCAQAPCIDACDNDAISRDKLLGIVRVDAEKCVGCAACVTACPHEAPRFFHEEKMLKCDLCIDRILGGMLPACVHTCPTRALSLKALDTATSGERPKQSKYRPQAI